ncbi:MAG: hypothetical protein JO001_21145 [Alphaproteobacteria bacterium]|nr:hypothetical protein [Alphaproteobacteria bacterium]
MPSLPTESLRAAEFIVRRMYRGVDLAAGVRFSAVSETERALDGDDWFWTDDNAKVLEYLSRPELWSRFPDETAQILHFVTSMCSGPFIFRRLSTPQLRLVKEEAGRSSYRHSLMSIDSDLGRGAIVAGLRFHDERNFDNLLLAGNRVEFTYQRDRFTVPVEAAISQTDADQQGNTLTLRHTSEVRFTPKRQELRAGRVTYVYRFDARSLLIEVEVTFEADAAIEICDVVLTVGHDQLTRWRYSVIDTDTRKGDAPLYAAGKPSRQAIDVAGASYYVVRQGHFSGDALALHSVPRDPKALSTIEAIGTIPGQLQQAVARYSFPGSHRGDTMVAAEHKLLTGGGLYDRVTDYAGFMREAIAAKAQQQAAYDFSTSYDYGVVINAFAKCFATAAAIPHHPHLVERRSELRALVDRYAGHYLDIAVAGHNQGKNTIFSRELAFVVLAMVTMQRATGASEYRDYLGRLCGALLDLEVPYNDVSGEQAAGFRMRMDALPIAHVDCHSASLLALVRAAPLVQDSRVFAAIDGGLRAYCLDSSVSEGRRVDGVGTVVIAPNGGRHSENAFWNFKAGLTLRLFGALHDTTDPTIREIAARHGDRIMLIEAILRRQLEHAVTEHGDAVEIRCSGASAETNSETQPWVMLGLLGHPSD